MVGLVVCLVEVKTHLPSARIRNSNPNPNQPKRRIKENLKGDKGNVDQLRSLLSGGLGSPQETSHALGFSFGFL